MKLTQKKDYFALSFSDHRLWIARAGRGKLRRFVEKKLPSGVIQRGEIKNKAVLTQVVAEIIKASGIKHKFAVVGLPEIKAFTRSFKLPVLSTEELDDAVRWESQPLLPFPLEKAYLDWMILEKTDKWTRVLVVALPQKLVEEYAQILESLGFQPAAFEITSLSLARLVEKGTTATLVVEIKEQEAVMVVVGAQGGIEVSSTAVFGAGQDITQEIKETVISLLGFYRKKVGEKEKHQKVTKMLFCGSKLSEGLIKMIQQETGIKASLVKTKQLALASMASLAQKDVAAPIDEKTINLIPLRIQGIYDKTARVREISFWLKLGLASLFFILFAYGVVFARVYFEGKRIEAEVIKLQALITPEIRESEERAKLLNARAKKIVSLSETRVEIVPFFALIRASIPEGVSLIRYSFDESKGVFFVTGLADRREDLLSFRGKLEEKEAIARVHIPLSSLEKEEYVNFTISVIAEK